VRVDIGEINNHLRAGVDPPGARAQPAAGKSFFDYRFAACVSPNFATYPVPEGVNSRLSNGTNY
jgi:hypothetical protein